MNKEKKLTDEEIIKALDFCYSSPCCGNGCPYFNKHGRNFCVEDKSLYKDMKRIVLEHAKQKAEIELLKSEIEKECQEHIEFAKLADKKIKGLEKARKNDYENFCEERGEFNKTIDEQKAEIERLTESYPVNSCMRKGCYCSICEKKNSCDECRKCDNCITSAPCKMFRVDVQKFARTIEQNAELQKQVDELKAKQVIECYGMIKGCDIVNQAVKDTAKEIYKDFMKRFDLSVVVVKEEVQMYFADKFGIEVE